MRFFVIIAVFIFSCSNDTSPEVTSSKKNKLNSTIEASDPNSLFSADVEGMVCKMGCAASIRKELTALNGISSVEIDFKEDKLKQLVRVSYNADDIDDSVIQKTIEKINNQQFQVTNGRTENLTN